METVCVKFGDLYSSEYVNQLYKQVGDPFYCMTEDREGIDSNIQILEANDEFPERKWWNKTKLFKPGLMEGPFVYFDLDCYVNNLKDIRWTENPQFIKTMWFSDDVARKVFSVNVNSSVMVINNNADFLWKEWYDNKQKLFKSFYGIDAWIYRRWLSNIQFIDPQIVYSYRYGHSWPDDVETNIFRDIPICIFDNVDNRDEVLKDIWNGRS